MNVISGLEALHNPLKDTVVAIGVFDGVHRGHQEILHQTVREARSQDYQPIALTFDINPVALFAPEHAPPSIVTLEQRIELIEKYGGGIETVAVVHFDHAFAGLSPEAFVTEILEGRLGARHVLVGADFCYGRNRSGNVTTLLQSGTLQGFAVTIVPPFLIQEERVSSTRIRQLIAQGDLPEARELLGHSFIIEGRVVAGKQLGRTLGYPTANLQSLEAAQLLPGRGIYAAYTHFSSGLMVRTAVSVGINPTIEKGNRQTVEAYLMDGFEEDLYGRRLAVDFRSKIRDEQQFDNLALLTAQIRDDVAKIESLLPVISVLQ
jgi:riboflavin kinase/FMN adenylyltransferase